MTTFSPTTDRLTVNPIKYAWAIVKDHWQAYITLNVLFYGLIIAGMLYTLIDPSIQQTLLQRGHKTFSQGSYAVVGEAYQQKQLLPAMLYTFIINLVLGSLVQMTLPSLILPFSGLLMGCLRAVLWGLMLSPVEASLAGPMIPHAFTLLLEGQGYILVMLSIYIHGKAIFRPQAYHLTRRKQGYREGLRRTGWIYLLVCLVLAIAAVYEPLEAIFLVPLLR